MYVREAERQLTKVLVQLAKHEPQQFSLFRDGAFLMLDAGEYAGVFRDVDAMLDCVPLPLTEAVRTHVKEKLALVRWACWCVEDRRLCFYDNSSKVAWGYASNQAERQAAASLLPPLPPDVHNVNTVQDARYRLIEAILGGHGMARVDLLKQYEANWIDHARGYRQALERQLLHAESDRDRANQQLFDAGCALAEIGQLVARVQESNPELFARVKAAEEEGK